MVSHQFNKTFLVVAALADWYTNLLSSIRNVFKFLTTNNEHLFALAARQGDFKEVNRLLKEQLVDVNLLVCQYAFLRFPTRSSRFYLTTDLHIAATWGRHTIIKLLIDYAEKIGIISYRYTKTAIFFATLCNHYKVVEYHY
jgi:hypothetical protein